MARRGIQASLDRIRSSEDRQSVESFYAWARGKATLDVLNEVSWPKSIGVLADWENFGYGEQRHPDLIRYYEDWKAEEVLKRNWSAKGAAEEGV